MNNQQTNAHSHGPGVGSPEIASELNNLLQIILGTSGLIENIWQGKPGSKQYFEMLRASIARAAEVTTGLVELSGRVSQKIVLHPAFARQQAAQKISSRRKQRLMVVDDEKMLLILTAEILRDAGYEVATAQSGFECLEMFRLTPNDFDLILLDLNMPLMDGEETFQRVRTLRPDQRVMLCTGYVQQERLNHMLEAGLAGFVQKPLGPQEYLQSVRTVLAEAVLGQTALVS